MSFTLVRSNNQNNKIIMNFGKVDYNYQQQRSNLNKVGGNFINLPQRKHKRNYDMDKYYCMPISRGNKEGGGEYCGASGNTKRLRRKEALPQYS